MQQVGRADKQASGSVPHMSSVHCFKEVKVAYMYIPSSFMLHKPFWYLGAGIAFFLINLLTNVSLLQHASRKLDKMADTVEAFVEHLIFLSRMGNEIASLEKEYNIVTRMYSIARNFEMSISSEELALYQMLMPSFQHLKVLDN